jgi:WD40 repeat protein
VETDEKYAPGKIVHAPGRALAVRSAALVARGLRDLARDSNWLIRKLFTGQTAHAAISCAGQIAAISSVAQFGVPRLSVYDMENNAPGFGLSVPNEPPICPPNLPAALAWSPNGKNLIAAWGGWQPKLHSFDPQVRALAGTFGDFAHVPRQLAWSDDGRYFAAASGGKRASLRVWEAKGGSASIAGSAAAELGVPSCIERQTYEAEFGDDGAFSGYGSTAFSPDGKLLASVVQIQGEWADDSILIVDVPGLREQTAAPAQGHITSLAWTPDGQTIIYCAAGQAYRLAVNTRETEPLPAAAEICACHPHLPVCLCYSSWLKNSAKGQLFLIDVNRMSVYDEHPAEGILHVRWSADGSTAYAVSQDGLAYIYEPPLI